VACLDTFPACMYGHGGGNSVPILRALLSNTMFSIIVAAVPMLRRCHTGLALSGNIFRVRLLVSLTVKPVMIRSVGCVRRAGSLEWVPPGSWQRFFGHNVFSAPLGGPSVHTPPSLPFPATTHSIGGSLKFRAGDLALAR